MIEGVPSHPLGATDALDSLPTTRDGRELLREAATRIAAQAEPPAVVETCERCRECGAILGRWASTHFAKVTDKRPCPGSWPQVAKKAGAK